MSTADQFWRSIQHTLPRSVMKRTVVGATLAVLAIAATLLFINRGTKTTTAADSIQGEKEEPQARTEVKLTQDKIRSAKLHTSRCQIRELRDLRTVPGTITFNPANHLEIKSPAEGVVKRVLVGQGQAVKKGDPLVILSSSEFGMARDALAQCKAELELTKNEAQRSEQIAANVSDLLDVLKQRRQPAEIEKQFDDKLLGQQRQQIIAAYSKLYLAESVMENSRPLEANGGISGRMLQERRSDREVAKAAFDTACEEAKFEVSQGREKTRAAVEHAERLLSVCRQRVESLSGGFADGESGSQSALSELVLKAPFDGVIQENSAVQAAHVGAGQYLMGLADTQSLWVAAEVPQRDWNALDGEAQRQLMLRVPGLSNSEISAQIKFTAGRISPETHTLSIVGELDNHEGRFRPGMFVWVAVPISHPQRVLAVPTSAIVQHEETKFVFVADSA